MSNPKRRYFLELAYKGTNYHGWQYQPNAITVQEVLNKCLSTILREEIQVTGAGRTDTGVHASYFVAHFDSYQIGIHNNIKFLFKINGILPKDISVFNCISVHNEANSRFDASERTYKYYINTIKNPFKLESSFYSTFNFNIDKMNEACEILFNYIDFTSFSKLHTDVKTNNCKITFAKWEKVSGGLIFTISADRFLRNMVRAIVGTLLEIGKEKIKPSKLEDIILSKDRAHAGASAPAHGLFLADIQYPYFKRFQE